MNIIYERVKRTKKGYELIGYVVGNNDYLLASLPIDQGRDDPAAILRIAEKAARQPWRIENMGFGLIGRHAVPLTRWTRKAVMTEVGQWVRTMMLIPLGWERRPVNVIRPFRQGMIRLVEE